MISHHDRCVFVHIPKCAGQSIEKFFLTRLGLDWGSRAPLLLHQNDVAALGPPRLAHLKASQYVDGRWLSPEQFNEYFKFAFVRNPWSRATSFYRYLGYRRRCTFRRFVTKHLPRELEKRNWFVGAQRDYVMCPGGTRCVDFIGRFENLDHDFAQICAHLGIAQSGLPHANNSNRSETLVEKMFSSKMHSYRDFYDANSEKIIAQLYQEDIEAFQYEF